MIKTETLSACIIESKTDAPFTAAFTLDVYGHVSDAMKMASANRMEEYVRQIPGI